MMRRKKASCRYCRDTPRWRFQLNEWALSSGHDPATLITTQRCPRCRNTADITQPPRDWRRIKRDRRQANDRRTASHG